MNRSAPTLHSIDEENLTDTNTNESADTIEDNKSTSNVSLQSITTYRNAFPNYYQNTHRPSGREQESIEENDEPIDTIQLEDDRARPPSASTKKSSKKSQAPIQRSSSTQRMSHPTDSIQYTDADGSNEQQYRINNRPENKKNMIDARDDEQEHVSVQDNMSSSSKTQPLPQRTDANKSRKIRDLQFKLSRQEEESKKQFDELQSKQSRLENAIKLLVKQTSALGKHRQPVVDESESQFEASMSLIALFHSSRSRSEGWCRSTGSELDHPIASWFSATSKTKETQLLKQSIGNISHSWQQQSEEER